MICLHSWFKWSKLIRAYDGHSTQFKVCKKCGLARYRNLGYCHGVEPDEANRALKETGASDDWRDV